MDGRRDDRDEPKKRSINLFGRDLTKIPCFKQSFFNGIASGVGIGLLVFMFTSRVPLACHSMMGSFGAITISYFSYCRYNFGKEQFMISQMQGLMQEAMVMEGADQDKAIQDIIQKVEEA